MSLKNFFIMNEFDEKLLNSLNFYANNKLKEIESLKKMILSCIMKK